MVNSDQTTESGGILMDSITLARGLVALVVVFGSLLVIRFWKGPHLDAETLAAYLDDELSEQEFQKVHAHVLNCGACRELVENDNS